MRSLLGIVGVCSFLVGGAACTLQSGEQPSSLESDSVGSRAAALTSSGELRPTGGTSKTATVAARSAAQSVKRPLPLGATELPSGTVQGGAKSASSAAVLGGASGACPYNFTSHGGAVISAPRVSRVFWGTWSSTTANSYDSTWSTLAATPSFYLRVSEYGIGLGTSGSRTNYAAGATGSRTETQIQSGLTSSLTSAGIVPTSQEVFVIFLPSGTTSLTDTNNGWAGHHSSYTATISGHSYTVRYAVIEYSSDPNYTNPVVSHELMEAFSDPDLNNWYEPGGNEIGDVCRFVAAPGGYASLAGVQVETVWSQKGCLCVAERDLNGVDRNLTGTAMSTVFRPSSQTWFGYGASPWWIFGASTDVPYAGDYNGDGRTEYSLFRDGSSASVFILDTAAGVFSGTTWGTTGDIPVSGDFDGDGKTDIAVWRPSNGTWYVKKSSDGSTLTQQWGVSTDVPTPGDYDGDHKTDFAVLRLSDHKWYVIPSSNPAGAYWALWAATAGDIAVPGDFDSDGFTDFAYWHPATGTFFVWSFQGGVSYSQQWGQSGDIPVARDYDGDFRSDLAVWRPGNGTWYYIYSTTGGTGSLQWGQAGDVPIERSVLR